MTDSRWIVCLSVAGLLTGCKEDCEDERTEVETPPEPSDWGSGPTMVDARWIAGDVLELQFSEPVTIDPNIDGLRVVAWDVDINQYSYGASAPYCSLYTRYSLFDPSDIWAAPESESIWRLRLSPAPTCATGSERAGFTVFHADNVADLDGNLLVDIGPDWLMTAFGDCSSYYYYSYGCTSYQQVGSLASMPVLLDIPCPS